MQADELQDWLILLVDDEPDSLLVAQSLLEMHGARVEAKDGGQAALDWLESEHPTLIITDLSMPNLSGWDLFEAVRTQAHLDDVPVIALTAHAMRGDRERVLAAGFSGYISKPLEPSSFVDDVLQCLS